MTAYFARLHRSQDGDDIVVNLAALAAIYPVLGESAGQDPFPTLIGSKLILPDRSDDDDICVNEFPDVIADQDMDHRFIRLEVDPVEVRVNRVQVAYVERRPSFGGGPGFANVYLKGHKRPICTQNGLDQVAERLTAQA